MFVPCSLCGIVWCNDAVSSAGFDLLGLVNSLFLMGSMTSSLATLDCKYVFSVFFAYMYAFFVCIFLVLVKIVKMFFPFFFG